MQQEPISSYIIVGGGTAGWIAAAVLARANQHSNVNIEVVESPNIPSIGVGEATIPSIMDLLEYLNIPAKDFILKTQATFKLGIKFKDWLTVGHEYWHQFGHIGNHIDGKPFYQHWLKHHMFAPRYALTDFSPAVALAKHDKFYITPKNQPDQFSTSSYALHFDAGLVAQYLTEYCKSLGVKHHLAHVDSVTQHTNGNIASVKLADGYNLAGDFFIDCTGQKALLMEKTLNVGFENWQHFLPVDSAIAVQSSSLEKLPPYTTAVAHEHGWRWQIPLQNRTGNGYVYCSEFCSDQAALELLEQHVSNFVTEPKKIKFITGKRDKIWSKNCLAVGLSSGFLEPLESTSIYLIMRTMLNFVQSLPTQSLMPATIKEFNRRIDHEYLCIRDFIVLHYCESKREDSAFWRSWQQREIPSTLSEKIALFLEQGRLFEDQYDLFSSQSWYAVLAGMNVQPLAYDPLVDASEFNKIEQAFVKSAQSLQTAASHRMLHKDYIKVLLS